MRRTYRNIFKGYEEELKLAVGTCESILDVGCGNNSPIRDFSKTKYCVGVDAFKPSIKQSKKLGIHNKYYNLDVLKIKDKFKKNEFDCVLASDLIEHLTKEEGKELIKQMERIAKKKVIIFTPNGFLKQPACKGNPWQLHKSGWKTISFAYRGYNVTGINGLKSLRGHHAGVKYKPKWLWIILSDITQLFVRKKPVKAFQLLAVKTYNEMEK